MFLSFNERDAQYIQSAAVNANVCVVAISFVLVLLV